MKTLGEPLQIQADVCTVGGSDKMQKKQGGKK